MKILTFAEIRNKNFILINESKHVKSKIVKF